MDIEERAAEWATSYTNTDCRSGDCLCDFKNDLIAAYLAGSARTQADYVTRYTSVTFINAVIN